MGGLSASALAAPLPEMNENSLSQPTLGLSFHFSVDVADAHLGVALGEDALHPADLLRLPVDARLLPRVQVHLVGEVGHVLWSQLLCGRCISQFKNNYFT